MRFHNIYKIIFCFYLSLSMILFANSSSFANEKIIIPDGIVYKEASEEINKKAEENLRKSLEGKFINFESLLPPESEQIAYIGTFLSNHLIAKVPEETLKILTSIKLGLPLADLTIISQSYAATKTVQRKLLAKILREQIKIGKNWKIRKVSREELVIIWFFIGWDLDEPIYVVEDENKKYVFDFDSSGEYLFWIDEISHPCIQLGQVGAGPLTSCHCLIPNLKDNKYDIQFVESCRNKIEQ